MATYLRDIKPEHQGLCLIFAVFFEEACVWFTLENCPNELDVLVFIESGHCIGKRGFTATDPLL
jgi:hypothetical protein